MNCEMALTTSARMEDPRRAAKFRTALCERRTAKFLSGPASPRNVAEFMTTQRSKRYDFKELATNGHTGARLLELPSEPPIDNRSREVGENPRRGYLAGSTVKPVEE